MKIKNYTDEINKTLSKLFDQFYPQSDREIIFIEQELLNLEGGEDCATFSIERGLELERIYNHGTRVCITTYV